MFFKKIKKEKDVNIENVKEGVNIIQGDISSREENIIECLKAITSGD